MFNPVPTTPTIFDTPGDGGDGGNWDGFLNDLVNGAVSIIDAYRGGPSPGGLPDYSTPARPAAATASNGLMILLVLVAAVYFLSES